MYVEKDTSLFVVQELVEEVFQYHKVKQEGEDEVRLAGARVRGKVI